MPAIIIEKTGDYITRTNGEVVNRTSIKLSDTIVSVPPEGMKAVTNIYFDPSIEKVVIVYNPES